MILCKIRVFIQPQQTILAHRLLALLAHIFGAHGKFGNGFQLFGFGMIKQYLTFPLNKQDAAVAQHAQFHRLIQLFGQYYF
ncbi:hypothetical protein D3C87_1984310 [compost metagenome]